MMSATTATMSTSTQLAQECEVLLILKSSFSSLLFSVFRGVTLDFVVTEWTRLVTAWLLHFTVNFSKVKVKVEGQNRRTEKSVHHTENLIQFFH